MDDEHTTPPEGLSSSNGADHESDPDVADLAIAVNGVATDIGEAARRLPRLQGHALLAAVDDLDSRLRTLGDLMHDAARGVRRKYT